MEFENLTVLLRITINHRGYAVYDPTDGYFAKSLCQVELVEVSTIFNRLEGNLTKYCMCVYKYVYVLKEWGLQYPISTFFAFSNPKSPSRFRFHTQVLMIISKR